MPQVAPKCEHRLRHLFGEIEGEACLDGVWACACLLHVPLGCLGEVLTRIYGVLKSPGVLFASFREGTGEGRDRLGRYYNYPSLATLEEIFREAAPWSSLEIGRSTGHGYDGAAIEWLNCTATKRK